MAHYFFCSSSARLLEPLLLADRPADDPLAQIKSHLLSGPPGQSQNKWHLLFCQHKHRTFPLVACGVHLFVRLGAVDLSGQTVHLIGFLDQRSTGRRLLSRPLKQQQCQNRLRSSIWTNQILTSYQVILFQSLSQLESELGFKLCGQCVGAKAEISSFHLRKVMHRGSALEESHKCFFRQLLAHF